MSKKYTENYRLDIAYATIFRNLTVLEEVPIHSALDITSGDNLTKKAMIAGDYSVFGGGGITENTHSEYNVDYGTIAIGRVGARCGCVFKVPPKSWVTDNALLVQSYDKRFSLDYIRHFLSYSALGEYANNAMQPVISKARIKDVLIPLVDIAEQKMFADLLNSIEKNERFENDNYPLLKSKLKIIDNWEFLIKELDVQKELSTQLKQSILQEAIQGKLTEEWRSQNQNIEPASKLLERIKAEKAQLIKEKKVKKGKPLPPISNEEIPFEIPQTWVWCRLSELCSKTGSGSTPKGGKAAYPSEGIKFLRSQNVYDGGLRYDGIVHIHEETHEKMKGTKVQAADLLLNITGGSIGRCCVVPKDFDTGNINQHVAIIRSIDSTTGYFLHKVVCSPYFQNMIIEVQTGAGREGLPKNKMDNIIIGLPPLKEQEAILEKLDLLINNCQLLEAEIEKSEQYANQLMQAVLKEAFSSEKHEVNETKNVEV